MYEKRQRAHAGEEIIVAKAGVPYARLVPLERPGPREPGLLGHLTMTAEFFDPLPPEELDAWEAAG